MGKSAGVLLRDIRPLKEELAIAAEEADISLNALCVRTLAAHFKVTVPERGKPRGRALSDSADVFLEMPEPLRRKIGVAAKQRGTTMQALIHSVLRDHLDHAAA